MIFQPPICHPSLGRACCRIVGLPAPRHVPKSIISELDGVPHASFRHQAPPRPTSRAARRDRRGGRRRHREQHRRGRRPGHWPHRRRDSTPMKHGFVGSSRTASTSRHCALTGGAGCSCSGNCGTNNGRARRRRGLYWPFPRCCSPGEWAQIARDKQQPGQPPPIKLEILCMLGGCLAREAQFIPPHCARLACPSPSRATRLPSAIHAAGPVTV